MIDINFIKQNQDLVVESMKKRGFEFDLSAIKDEVILITDKIKKYVPGYDVVVEPYISSLNTVSATVKVTGAGYFLPSYAGNLDIINAAAVETARRHAETIREKF